MVEQLRPGVSAQKARICIFDFDGTLSLIRSGWMEVMAPMMVEILLDLKTGESEDELRSVVEDFVWRLTGKQTIYQMIELAGQIAKRGGRPLDPLVYKKMYLDRLHRRIRYRLEELRQEKVPPEKYLVPGARDLVLDGDTGLHVDVGRLQLARRKNPAETHQSQDYEPLHSPSFSRCRRNLLQGLQPHEWVSKGQAGEP